MNTTHTRWNWDCNCDNQYIHLNIHRLICPICKAHEEDAPESMEDEAADPHNHFLPRYLLNSLKLESKPDHSRCDIRTQTPPQPLTLTETNTMKTNTQLATEAIGFPPTKMTEDDLRLLKIKVLRRDFARIKKTSSLTGLKVLLKKEEKGKRKSTLIIHQLKIKIQQVELEQRHQQRQS